MITLTEKRLQELENRIPDLLKQISETQEKIIEIYQLPNDLAEIKNLHQNLSKLLSDHIERYASALDASDTRYSILDGKTKDLPRQIDESQRAISNLENTISGHVYLLSEMRNQLKDLTDKMIDKESKIANLDMKENEQRKNIESHSQTLSEMNSKLNIANTNALLDASTRHDEEFSKVREEIRQTNSAFQKLLNTSMNDMMSKFTTEINILTQKMPSPIIPISYDSQILDLKRDITSILSMINSKTSPGSDQTKLDEKIKMIENNIAQIYVLLKKYEPQA